jgi:TolA-binding protein
LDVQLKSGIGLGLAFAFLLAGCATHSKTDKRVHALQLKIKKQRAKLQDLKERNLVLERRVKMGAPTSVEEAGGERSGERRGEESIVQSAPPAELPGSFVAAPAGMSPKVTLASKLPAASKPPLAPMLPAATRVATEKTGEHFLYSKIIDTYRSKNKEELERTQQLLLKSYPESVFADNAIYLAGLLAFEQRDYKAALKHFDKLLKEYPRSNKAVAALFAKASVEKRLGRASDAKRGFIRVRDLYPGSPEATRVSVELKLLESASVKSREF